MKFVASLAVLLALANVAHAQTLGSCPIFPPNNPWNERIDTLPVHPRSQSYINSVGSSIHVHPDFGSNSQYGIPWIAVNGSQPFVPIDLTNGYIDESDPGPMPIPDNAPVEYPPPPGGDAHVLVVDTENHHLYELYQGIKQGAGWAATSSAIFALDSNKFRPDGWTSCDAAGLPIFPGLVRKYECDAGEIKHALRFTIQHSSRGYIFPARHYASSNTDTANVMPMGMRLRLKSTYDDSKFTGNAKVISTALKRYGIILADNGSNWYISGENNTKWDDNDVGQLKAITGNDFEVVYTGPIRIRPNQYPDPDLSGGSTGQVGVLTVSPSTYSAGSQPVGVQSYGSIALKNTGSYPVTIVSDSLYSATNVFSKVGWVSPQVIQPDQIVEYGITFQPPSTGVYQGTLTLTTNEPMSSIHTIQLVGEGAKSINGVQQSDIHHPFGLTISPNPANTIATVRLEGRQMQTNIDIFSAVGKRIMCVTMSTDEMQLDITGLSSGVYFVRGTNGSGEVANGRLTIAR